MKPARAKSAACGREQTSTIQPPLALRVPVHRHHDTPAWSHGPHSSLLPSLLVSVHCRTREPSSRPPPQPSSLTPQRSLPPPQKLPQERSLPARSPCGVRQSPPPSLPPSPRRLLLPPQEPRPLERLPSQGSPGILEQPPLFVPPPPQRLPWDDHLPSQASSPGLQKVPSDFLHRRASPRPRAPGPPPWPAPRGSAGHLPVPLQGLG